MSTLGTMITRIGVETGFSQATYEARIQDAILAAKDHFERMPYWFNQSEVSITFSATHKYTMPTPNFFKVTGLYVIDSSETYSLTPVNIKRLEGIQSNTARRPSMYSIYNNTIVLDAVPDVTYMAKMIGFAEAVSLSTTAVSNHWMVEAEVMIRAYAKGELYLNYVQQTGNEDKATRFYTKANSEHASHRKKTNRLLATGSVKGW